MLKNDSNIYNDNDDNKQILHALLFNVRNYLPRVFNIQRRETSLNIILPRINNFDINKKNGMQYLFYYLPPTLNKMWENKG